MSYFYYPPVYPMYYGMYQPSPPHDTMHSPVTQPPAPKQTCVTVTMDTPAGNICIPVDDGPVPYNQLNIKHWPSDDYKKPKISLFSGAFFVASLINIPIGPTSVHPLLGGLLGLILGKHAPLAVLVGLILQVLLFQHGGISTFGANMLLMSLPAIFVYWLFTYTKRFTLFWKGL